MAMHTSWKMDRPMWTRLAGLVCASVLITGCTLSNQEAPPLQGPSGFGLSVRMSATPEILPRDGVSRSTINVEVELDDQPFANGRLVLTADAGTLSAAEVVTDAKGHATFYFTAPGVNDAVDLATIYVTAVQNSDLANARSDSIRVAVMGPDVPAANFFTTPATTAPGPKVLTLITFDASGSMLAGVMCKSSCTYAWNFGDGSTGKDMVTQHQYSAAGVYNVTLTVTANNGTTNSVTKAVVIAPPDLTTADFTFLPCASLVAKCVTFTDSSVPDNGVSIASYYWDFGDGTTPVSTNSPTIDHTFPANPNPVTYVVRLRLTDNLGRVSLTTKSVAVP
jgi:PKD repeat protein